jgi:hypothetical protein
LCWWNGSRRRSRDAVLLISSSRFPRCFATCAAAKTLFPLSSHHSCACAAAILSQAGGLGGESILVLVERLEAAVEGGTLRHSLKLAALVNALVGK